jgi:hypothetical protein
VEEDLSVLGGDLAVDLGLEDTGAREDLGGLLVVLVGVERAAPLALRSARLTFLDLTSSSWAGSMDRGVSVSTGGVCSLGSAMVGGVEVWQPGVDCGGGSKGKVGA